jgi:hypothetical protein
MKIGRCLIDANWGHSTDVVYQFCRQSPHASILLPSHGRFVGASSNPFSEYKRRPGDRVGLNWRVPTIHGKRAIRHVIYDTNWWKSFTHARLAVAMGDRGCLSIFGDRPDQHRMFAEQVTAEYFVRTEGRGRTVDEWKARPEQPDNHWLDCLVGCAVAASMQGGVVVRNRSTIPAPKRRASQLQRDLQRRNNTTSSNRPRIAEMFGFGTFDGFQAWIRSTIPLARQVEQLSPSVMQDGPNAEYPWPHNAPAECPAEYQFDVWEDLKKSHGRKLMRFIADAIEYFPDYA